MIAGVTSARQLARRGAFGELPELAAGAAPGVILVRSQVEIGARVLGDDAFG
jgi:hypothetical protein